MVFLQKSPFSYASALLHPGQQHPPASALTVTAALCVDTRLPGDGCSGCGTLRGQASRLHPPASLPAPSLPYPEPSYLVSHQGAWPSLRCLFLFALTCTKVLNPARYNTSVPHLSSFPPSCCCWAPGWAGSFILFWLVYRFPYFITPGLVPVCPPHTVTCGKQRPHCLCSHPATQHTALQVTVSSRNALHTEPTYFSKIISCFAT